MSEEVWSLHPQLENDTAPVGDLTLCRILAINVADYPWLILVPRRHKPDAKTAKPVSGNDHAPSVIVEIADLEPADAARLMQEIALVSRVLQEVTRCDKLNVAAIGNVVPQLHIHIVARWKTDALWPKPVWGHATVRAGDAEGFGRFVKAIRILLEFAPQE
ncbi:MAG: HIT family protein [Xanthobacteraceae bacterium]